MLASCHVSIADVTVKIIYSSIPKKYTMKTYFVDFVMELSRVVGLHWHIIHTSFYENWLFGLQEMGVTLYAW